MARKSCLPKYSLHKGSGQAFVYVARKPVYLGVYGSAESKREYRRVLAELEESKPIGKPSKAPVGEFGGICLAELVAQRCAWLKANQKSKWAIDSTLQASELLIEHFGDAPVSSFGVLAFEQWRNLVIKTGSRQQHRTAKKISAKWVNQQSNAIKSMLKWGVARDYFPADNFLKIEQVESISGDDKRVSRSLQREPITDNQFNAIVGIVSPPISAILRLLFITGARPDEITIMRPKDIERSGEVWIYTVQEHKTRWRTGKAKQIPLGKQAQAILTDWLADCPKSAFVFSPKREIGKVGCCDSGEHYTDESLNRAVCRACRRAKVERWTPYQLRHTVATRIGESDGLESARVQLGHKSIDTTLIYAKQTLNAQIELARRLG